MGCARCGECCIDRTGTLLIGGSEENDHWLRHHQTLRWVAVSRDKYIASSYGECRFLLPPDKKGRRLCAIHKHPLRPAACRDFPNIANAAIPDDCKQGRKARSLRSQRAQVRVAPAPPSSLPDPA